MKRGHEALNIAKFVLAVTNFGVSAQSDSREVVDAGLHPRLMPYPCGYYGSTKRECRCGPIVVQRYRQRISGPLLDRIDLHVDVPTVELRALRDDTPSESSADIRLRVERVRDIQAERFIKDKGIHTNSAMTPRHIKKHCELDAEGAQILEHAMGQMNFSARAHDRILKVARTLADMGGLEKISADNIGEAIQYRTLDRNLWV